VDFLIFINERWRGKFYILLSEINSSNGANLSLGLKSLEKLLRFKIWGLHILARAAWIRVRPAGYRTSWLGPELLENCLRKAAYA
jgi:hypothetical protein